MKYALPAAAVLAAAALITPAYAHFILHAPTPSLAQNGLGDPQKLGPCGGTTANAGTPTNVITEAKGGDTVHIKIQETIYHPGHYRIALAVKSRSELPADPETVTRDTPRGPYSVSAKIDPAPKPPVLVDGLFVHTTRPEAGSFWETDVKLPNINCEKCSLQVIQWMAEHGVNPDGMFTYHHCADFKITANPGLPIDKRWPGQ